MESSFKKCTKCLEIKSIDLFGRNPKYKDGILSWCKACQCESVKKYNKTEKGFANRKKNLAKWRAANKDRWLEIAKFSLYKSLGINITEEEYRNLYKNQEGCCAICGVSDVKLGKMLVLDHCHFSGKVRGFLCGTCNSGIGLYKDDVRLLENALEYLNTNG